MRYRLLFLAGFFSLSQLAAAQAPATQASIESRLASLETGGPTKP